MPPRHKYWTILIDNAPTAFRSATREELQPTFEQLRRKHPSAVMRWFARGRIWTSPYEAEQAARAPREPRGPSWRPGGRHKDPREAARQKRQQRNAERRAERFERKQARPHTPPGGTAGPRASTWRPGDERSRQPAGKARGQQPSGRRPDLRGSDSRHPVSKGGRPAHERPMTQGERSWNRPHDRSHIGSRPQRERWPYRDARAGVPPFPDPPDRRGSRIDEPRDADRPALDAAHRKDRKSGTAGRQRSQPGRRPRPTPTPVPRPGREKPPAHPLGPDRPPRPGQEPSPEPVRPEEIVTPHAPPERGSAGPGGSRLIKRRQKR